MNILIIEDEPRAANQLQAMLRTCKFDYQLLDIIDSVEEAISWFQQNPEPELVFMDIQLADGLSFEIFQKVEVKSPIIFTTAFDQYAIQAFKVNSVDYLLKPIQEDELSAALGKFLSSNSTPAVPPDILQQLLSSFQTPQKRSGILVKSGGGFVQVKVSDVLYFYSEESVTFGITDDNRFIIDETIDQLLDSLPPEEFYRINRGQLISKNAIHKFEPYFNHRVKLTVANPRDQEFIVSRPKTSDFKTWMNS